MKLPYVATCKIVNTDTLTVTTDLDNDIAIVANNDKRDHISLYLSSADARKLRKALKVAIRKAEKL